MDKQLTTRLAPLIILVGVIWAVFIIDWLLGGWLSGAFAIEPRVVRGLDGLIGAPFLHANWGHLIANTAPLLILGAIILITAPLRFLPATVFVVLIGGLLTWIFGRQALHIGASGLVFGWFAFIVALAVVERRMALILAAVAALALYGATMLGGLAPRAEVSWESHLFGALAGVGAAWLWGRQSQG